MVTSIKDLIFPAETKALISCSEYLPLKERKKLSTPYKHISPNSPLNYIFTITDFSNLKDLIHRAKFQGEWSIVSDFVELILESRVLSETMQGDIFTYVPPDSKRSLQRGYHIPQMLAKKCAHQTQKTCVQLVDKLHHTPSQILLNKEKRASNLKSAFKCDSYPLTSVNNIWIFDDIYTTGATITEVAGVIKESAPHVSIKGICLASQTNL